MAMGGALEGMMGWNMEEDVQEEGEEVARSWLGVLLGRRRIKNRLIR